MDHQFRSKQYQLTVVIKIYVKHLGFHDTSTVIPKYVHNTWCFNLSNDRGFSN